VLGVIAGDDGVVEAIHQSMETLLFLGVAVAADLAETADDYDDVEAADDLLVTLRILKQSAVGQQPSSGSGVRGEAVPQV